MQLSHSLSRTRFGFDDPNLVSCAGLVPVLALAARCGLDAGATTSLGTALTVPSPHAAAKTVAVVAGMVAGADSIDGLDLLRHGGMRRLFDGVRAPSTLGTFLRSFTFGHVRQLDRLAAQLLTGLAGHTPLLPDVGRVCLVDIDDTVKATYGYAKQGAGYGYNHVNGINALLATISTPTGAPVIAATRLRRGPTSSPRGASHLVAAALATAKRCGAGRTEAKTAVPGEDMTGGTHHQGGLILLRADAGFYNADMVAACRRAGAQFSITVKQNVGVSAAIAAIPEQVWTPIRYPDAVYDEQAGGWISDAEVAETSYRAFGGRGIALQVTARLIVRRVPRLQTHPDQDELFPGYRYHALFTDSPLPMLQAETCHRGHAIIEQVIADLKNGPLAHLPSGRFTANAAWLTLAAMAHNLTRAAGCLASTFHAKARPATIRAQLISLPARIARSARTIALHLPRAWPWEHAWRNLTAALR